MAMKYRASKMLRDFEDEGWRLSGEMTEDLDSHEVEGDSKYEYKQISLMMGRKLEDENG